MFLVTRNKAYALELCREEIFSCFFTCKKTQTWAEEYERAKLGEWKERNKMASTRRDQFRFRIRSGSNETQQMRLWGLLPFGRDTGCYIAKREKLVLTDSLGEERRSASSVLDIWAQEDEISRPPRIPGIGANFLVITQTGWHIIQFLLVSQSHHTRASLQSSWSAPSFCMTWNSMSQSPPNGSRSFWPQNLKDLPLSHNITFIDVCFSFALW